MKILFICRQNIGRSQMAKAFYNSLTGSRDADAAGTIVDETGETLQDRKRNSTSKNFFLLDVMNDVGIDISQATRDLLTIDMLPKYDKVISMAEKDASPEWLLTAPNYTYWNVSDPKNQDYETTAHIRDEIKDRVQKLLS